MPLDDTRAAWRAGPPLRPLSAVPHHARVGVTWHWAGPPTGLFGKPHTACLAMVRAWQLFHQSKGWKDIGYPALVCVHARAIEGRGLGYVGSHAPSWNTSHWGVQFMVGEGESVTPAMFARAAKLRADLAALAGRSLVDKRHRDDPRASTECCGRQIGTWVTTGGPTTTTKEDDMPITAAEFAKIADAAATEVWTRPVRDAAGNAVPTGDALGRIFRSSQAALELAKAQAQAGRPLSAAETKAIVDAALDEKIEDATGTVILNATPGPA